MHQPARFTVRPVMLVGASLCLSLVACRAQKPPETHRYELKGKVVAVEKARKQLVVDHQAIPGFMAAMTMPYSVKDDSLLNDLAPGDQIAAELVVAKDSAWLDTIVVIKRAEDRSPPLAGNFHMPQKGEEVPNFTLVNQDGNKIRLNQYRGKALLLTFIYTRCPLPDYCQLMTNNFAAIEQALAKDPQLYSRTHLLSISFDSQNDTPKVLRAYAEKHVPPTRKRIFEHWEFAVASEPETLEITKFFGIVSAEGKGAIVHSLSTTVISPDGRIYAWYHDNTWKPEDVMKELRNQ